MKKIILCGAALLLSVCAANAQGWETTGAHDDFAQTDFYKNGPNGEGLVWWGDAEFAMTRTGTGELNIVATNAGGAGHYPLFGVNFNDANDNGTGTPFVVDLSGGMADIVLDIENTSTTELLFIDVKLVDNTDKQSQYEPNVSDVLPSVTFPDAPYPRKALNGFTLGPGAHRVVRLDLSSVPGNLGGLTEGAYTCTKPYDCPVTSYQINPAVIKAVLFRVNFGSSDINLSQDDGDFTVDTLIQGADIFPYNGTIVIREFKIGTPVVTTSVNSAVAEGSFSIYPNPATDALTVTFNATEGAVVSLTDIVGNVVYTTSANAGENKIAVNTTGLVSGMYILSVVTEHGRSAQKVSIR